MNQYQRYLDKKGRLRERKRRSYRGSTPQHDLLVTPADEARANLAAIKRMIEDPSQK